MPPMMGSEYGRPGNTWSPGSDERFNAEHGIDPNTGGLTGPQGAVPEGVAMNWQMAHNQAIFDLRQQWMQGGIGAEQSALGSLQSFRPGGLAALESGAYSRLADRHFQRASMTEPMDLMGDFVRGQGAKARAKANRAGEFRTTAGLVLGAAAIAAPFLLAPAAAAGVGAGAGIAGGGMSAGMDASSIPSAAGAGGAAAQSFGAAAGMGSAMMGQQGQQQGGLGQVGQQAVGKSGGQAQPFAPMGQQGSQQGGGVVGQPLLGPSTGTGFGTGVPSSWAQPWGAQGGQGAPGGGQAGQAQMGGGGAAGPSGGAGSSPAGGGGAAGGGGGAGLSPGAGPGGKPRVGATGDFSPLAFSVAAAANPSPAVDAIQTMVMERLADLVENDPDWGFMDALWSKQLRARKTYGIYREAGMMGEESSARMAVMAERDRYSGRGQ